jgi:hypothetical protein
MCFRTTLIMLGIIPQFALTPPISTLSAQDADPDSCSSQAIAAKNFLLQYITAEPNAV